MDELTEYAMAKEGIEHKDIELRPFEEFLKECHGNQKLAQMRYEFKIAERNALIQDIENRKAQIHQHMHSDKQTPGAHIQVMNQSNSRFFQTQQQ